MGSDLYIKGFGDPDGKSEEYAKIWELCEKQGIDVPPRVEEFFCYQRPADGLVPVHIPRAEYHDENSSGYDIKVADIPANVVTIRVVVS